MKINDIYEVEIYNLDHYGRGIARVENDVVFIENALKGEIVRIKIIKVNKKYSEAKVIDYVKKSEIRINPVCPYYEKCGGCSLMHLSYEEQLKYKESKVIEIIKKFTNIDVAKIKHIISSNNNLNYRNKASFHVSNEIIGYYKENTNDIIKIDKCYIVDEKINYILKLINGVDTSGIKNICIRTGKNISNIMVIFDVNHNFKYDYLIELLKDEVESIYIKENGIYKNIYGIMHIKDKISKYEFLISPDSFFQVNTSGAEILYSKVLEYAELSGKEKVLDLYCGTGSIGIFLSSNAKELYGIEINKYAVADANLNKELNKLDNISFKCFDLTKINNIDDYYDVVVVDPPRAGLSDASIKCIFNINPKRIVYVSCDPVTLARDLNKLEEKYNVTELTPVDMFPNTYHCETICVLERR